MAVFLYESSGTTSGDSVSQFPGFKTGSERAFPSQTVESGLLYVHLTAPDTSATVSTLVFDPADRSDTENPPEPVYRNADGNEETLNDPPSPVLLINGVVPIGNTVRSGDSLSIRITAPSQSYARIPVRVKVVSEQNSNVEQFANWTVETRDYTVSNAVMSSASYVDDAYADNYFAQQSVYAGPWVSSTVSVRRAALVHASRLLDSSYTFIGRKATQSQVREWPRVAYYYGGSRSGGFDDYLAYGLVDKDYYYIPSNVVPQAVKEATCELAKELLSSDREDLQETAAVKEIKVGEVEVKFDESTTVSSRPTVVPDVVENLLYGLIKFNRLGTDFVVPVVRS